MELIESAYENLRVIQRKTKPTQRGQLFSLISGHFDNFGELIERAHRNSDIIPTAPNCVQYEDSGSLTYSNLRQEFISALGNGILFEGCLHCPFHQRKICPIPETILNSRDLSTPEQEATEATGKLVGSRLFTLLRSLNGDTGSLIFDINEIAQILRCSTRTVYRLSQHSECTTCVDGKIVLTNSRAHQRPSCEICQTQCPTQPINIPRFDNRNIFPFPVSGDTAERCNFIWELIHDIATNDEQFHSLLLGHGYESHFERGLLGFIEAQTNKKSLMNDTIGIDYMSYGDMLPFQCIQGDMLDQISRFVYRGNMFGTFSLITSVGIEFILETASPNLLRNFFDNLNILMKRRGALIVKPWRTALDDQRQKLRLDDMFDIHIQNPSMHADEWQTMAVLIKK